MNNRSPLSSFGDALKLARKRKRLTQKKLANLLGVHYNTISSWELGTYLPETRGMVLELARCLELDEQETRQLLDASLTALSPHWNIPYQRNPFFTGRDHILSELHDALHNEHSSTPSHSCALSGLAGIGKTQCAIEYAYRYVNDYTAVFWLRAQSRESLVTSFIAIADLLNLPEWREKDQGRVVAAVIQWLNSHSQWLLIFDNIEDIALMKDFLPATRDGFLLFTSRRQSLGVTTRALSLGLMTLEEGRHFLLRRAMVLTSIASDQLPLIEDNATREILIAMDGLPLALDQAGSYIEATRCGLSDYVQLYRSSQFRLLGEREPHADHPESVIRTFTLIFEQIERDDPRAVELLTACAFLAPEAIPDAFFSEGAADLGPTFEALNADPFAFYAVIKTLLKYSLLQRDMATHTVTIHRLVQEILREKLSNTVYHLWVTRVVRVMSHIFPSIETMQTNYWQDCERFLPHALVCLTLSEEQDEDEVQYIISLMNHIATYFVERARYAEAKKFLQQALELGERILGTEHPQVAETLYGLGSFALRQGQYEEVEPFYLRALQIREQTLGSDHPQVATALNGLALFYSRQGRYRDAEPLYLRALQIREQVLGSDHPQVATALNGLAVLYGDLGRYAEAESLYLRALHIREQTLGRDHPQVATLLNNIAQDFKDQGRGKEAEPLFLRALHIWEQDLGPQHPRVAYPLNNLAELYRDQEKYEKAEPLFLRALYIWEQDLGPEHFLVADALDGLATLYREQERYKEAEPLFQRALLIREQALGLQHPYVAASLTGLAALYSKQERFDDAMVLYQRALLIREQALNPQHPDIAEILHYQAYIYQMQLQTEQALLHYQKALTIRQQVLGPEHLKTKATQHAYTQLLLESEHEEVIERFSLKDS